MRTTPTIIKFHGDGLSLTPEETTILLQKLAAKPSFTADSYSRGGVVATLESRMAQYLGKERAVFMPTGTLANHLAVRALCASRGRRVMVQAESHLVNDAGDCAQTLSNLNLIPLAPGQSCFTAQDVREVLARAQNGKVATPVGAMSIESPVRRLDNVAIPLTELKTILEPARDAGLGLHLDGARLPLYSPHFKIEPSAVAALFDTVYVSLYKCFSAPAGAILAGPASLLDGIYHSRRMFGGGMNAAWPMAAIALHHMDGYDESAVGALALAEELFVRLKKDGRCCVECIANGTNVFHLRLEKNDPWDWRQKLAHQGVELPEPDAESGVFTCKINPTLLRTTVDKLERILLGCL